MPWVQPVRADDLDFAAQLLEDAADVHEVFERQVVNVHARTVAMTVLYVLLDALDRYGIPPQNVPAGAASLIITAVMTNPPAPPAAYPAR